MDGLSQEGSRPPLDEASETKGRLEIPLAVYRSEMLNFPIGLVPVGRNHHYLKLNLRGLAERLLFFYIKINESKNARNVF